MNAPLTSEVVRHFAQEKALEAGCLPQATQLLGAGNVGLVADDPRYFKLGTDAFYHAEKANRAIGIEFKFEQQTSRNVCIELVSQDKNGKLGWYYTSQAAWLLSFFTSHQKHVLFIPMDCLRMVLSPYLDDLTELLHHVEHANVTRQRSPFGVTSTLNYDSSRKTPIYVSWNLLLDVHWVLDNVPDAFIVDASEILPSISEKRTDSIGQAYWAKQVPISQIEDRLLLAQDQSTPLCLNAAHPELVDYITVHAAALDMAIRDLPFRAGDKTKYDHRIAAWINPLMQRTGLPQFSQRPYGTSLAEHPGSGIGQAQLRALLRQGAFKPR